MFRKKTVQNKSSFNLLCFCHLRAAWQWGAGTGASAGVGAPRFLCAQSHLLSTAQHLQKPWQFCITPSSWWDENNNPTSMLNRGPENLKTTLRTFVTAFRNSWCWCVLGLPFSWLCPSFPSHGHPCGLGKAFLPWQPGQSHGPSSKEAVHGTTGFWNDNCHH